MGPRPPAKPIPWHKIVWSRPDSPQPVLCAYCHGGLPEVPLMMWKPDGACAAFCDPCAASLFALIAFPENRER